MQAHCLQHVPFENMAAIETWLKNNFFDISCTRLYKNEKFPKIDYIDWLVIMGGPMSVNDGEEFPWMKEEKKFVEEFIRKGKIVIGVCLGAQIIAGILGSKIYKNPEKEIGWYPIKRTNDSRAGIFKKCPSELTVFHWHGETFDLPEGAELIASSEACKNQIFTWNKNVVGFQCHLETTKESLSAMIENCKNEIVPASFIQNINELQAGENKYIQTMNMALFDILDQLLLHRYNV